MIGRVIGRYRITEPLGEGGMGTVWKAKDQLLGRTVALKLMSDRLWNSETARERFLREARAASKLEHPGIAAVFDAGQDSGLLYIAFQYVDGETLAAMTAHGPLPLSKALGIATGVADALDHAHGRGVLHRDVTAGNLMVRRDGRAVIVDFGLALPDAAAGLTTTGTVAGTVQYLAPEVFAGKRADARSDLYSFGVVLYRIMTGHMPFEGATGVALPYRIMNEEVPPPSSSSPEIPDGVDRIVMRLLEKDPADRFPSAQDLLQALRRIEIPSVTGARTAPIRHRADLGIRSRIRAVRRGARALGRRRIGIATLAVVLPLIVITWWTWQRGWVPGIHQPIRTLAVLPILNADANTEETAYLSEGLGEELTARLGQMQGFRVLPWITTARYAHPQRSLAEIAKELGATDLVVGSYRSDGERIRVTVALVDGKKGWQRWSQVFEEHVSDLFAIQRSVALGVAGQLKPRITEGERQRLTVAPSTSPEAYEYFLRGANYLHSDDPQTESLALPFFQKAVEIDSTLAEAYVGLGAHRLQAHFRGEADASGSLLQAETDFRLALSLDPRLAAAKRGLIRVYTEMGKKEQGLELAHTALVRGGDDVDALLVAGWGYTLGGLPEKAIAPLNRVLELDPANQGAAWYRVIALIWSDQPDLSLQGGKAYIRRYGEDAEIYTWMGVSAHCLDRAGEARLYYERAIQLFGEESDMYVVAYAATFYMQQNQGAAAEQLCRKWIKILEERLRRYPDNARLRWILTSLHCILRNRADVLRLMEPILRPESDAIVGGGDQITLFLPAASLAGTEIALACLRTLRANNDLATAWAMTQPCFIKTILGEAHSDLANNAEYQKFMSDVVDRVEYLRARY